MFRRPGPSVPSPARLAELRDLGSPSAAARAGAEFGRETHFAADLLRVRPWLSPDTPGRELPGHLLAEEWTGFLALLGEPGPWVYAPSVSDLQRLLGSYAQLAAAQSTGPGGAGEAGAGSLLGRLGYAPTPERLSLEVGFWALAAGLAEARRASRRRG